MKGRDCDFLIPDGTERNARNIITRIGGPWSENRTWDLSEIQRRNTT
jgi:hypothetical protein